MFCKEVDMSAADFITKIKVFLRDNSMLTYP